MPASALQQLKAIEKQRSKLVKIAKKEALLVAEEAVKNLNALGENYRLVNGSTTNRTATKTASNLSVRVKKKSRIGTRTPKDVPCPICTFKTMPPHDRRSHRMQKTKKVFSAKQLSEKGMKQV